MLKDASIENLVVIPVSPYLERSYESPKLLTKKEQKELTIDYDGRYNQEFIQSNKLLLNII